MADSNLNSSISALVSDLQNQIATATATEILLITRAAKSLGHTENTAIEIAVNTRVNQLTSTATADELEKLARAVDNLTENASTPAATTSIDDHTDVDTTTATPTDGQALVWQSSTGLWKPGDVASDSYTDILPDITATYDIGSPSKTWVDVYASNIKGLDAPTNDTDAARKKYVDDLFASAVITVNSVNGYQGSVLLTTDDVDEGIYNLYYDDTKVDLHLNQSSATNNQILSWNGTDYTWIDNSSLSTVSGNIIPDTTETYDLGSATYKFRDLYLSGNSITLGTIELSDNGGSLEITPVSGGGSTEAFATETYVTTQVANLVDSAPATLDTLNELAAALGDDANFSTTITNSLANKLESSDLNGYATETYVGDQIAAAGSYSDASVDSHLNRSAATTGQILTWNGTDYAWVDASSSMSVSDTAPSSPSNGDTWFNSTDTNTYMWYSDGDSNQWIQLNGTSTVVQNITNNNTVFGNPTITSVSPNNFDGSSGTVITIQGTNFDVGTVVSFIDANGVETNASATSIVTQGELTATIPQAYTSAEGPLDVKVTVGDGQTITSTDAIQTGGSPTWTTAAGQLGSSLYKDQTGVSLQIEATDPDGQFVSYEIGSGSLAPGLSLAAGTGLITGDITTASITADTNYSFTANANDTAGNSTPRTFFINVLNSGQLVNYVWRNTWGNNMSDGLMGHDYGRSPQFISFYHTAYMGDSTNGSLFWGDGNNQSAQQDTSGSHFVNSTTIDNRMNALKSHVDGGGTFDFHISGYNTGANEFYTFDSTSSNIYKIGDEWRMGGFSHLSFMRSVAGDSNGQGYIGGGLYNNPKYITISIPY